jgi:hypothetical protein
MDIARAFRFAFEGDNWVEKLLISALFAYATILMMPALLIGLLPLCLLLGYLLEVVNRVRDEAVRLLPPWNENFFSYLTRGAGVLLAVLVYNLPVLIITACALFASNTFATSTSGSLATLAVLGCTVPLLLIYVSLVWPILAVGVIRYARGMSVGVFFTTGKLWDTVSVVGDTSIQWLVAVLIVNVAAFVALLVPILGWTAVAALYIPVMGHFIGQYARRIDAKERGRSGAVPRRA